MKELQTKKYKTSLREKLQKYLHYDQVKSTNMNILQLKKYHFVVISLSE